MNPNRDSYTWLGFDFGNSELWADGSPSSATSSWRELYNVHDAGDRTGPDPVVFMRSNGDWSFDPKYYEYGFICESSEQSGASINVGNLMSSISNDDHTYYSDKILKQIFWTHMFLNYVLYH